METQTKEQQIALYRKLQVVSPAVMLLIAAVIYWKLPRQDMGHIIAGIVAFMAVPDFFLFKFMADRLENKS